MAEQKNREMYKQSSSVIPLAGYEVGFSFCSGIRGQHAR